MPSTSPLQSFRVAVHFWPGPGASIYVSWPFGVISLHASGVEVSIRPAPMAGLAGLISGVDRSQVARWVPWSGIDAVEFARRRAYLRSEQHGDVLVISLSAEPIDDFRAHASMAGVKIVAVPKGAKCVNPPKWSA